MTTTASPANATTLRAAAALWRQHEDAGSRSPASAARNDRPRPGQIERGDERRTRRAATPGAVDRRDAPGPGLPPSTARSTNRRRCSQESAAKCAVRSAWLAASRWRQDCRRRSRRGARRSSPPGRRRRAVSMRSASLEERRVHPAERRDDDVQPETLENHRRRDTSTRNRRVDEIVATEEPERARCTILRRVLHLDLVDAQPHER